MGYNEAAQHLADVEATRFGEATDYTDANHPIPLRVQAVWGDAVLVDAGERVAVYQREVLIEAAQFVNAFGAGATPRVGGTLTRLPDDLPNAEAWLVLAPDPNDATWSCLVQRKVV